MRKYFRRMAKYRMEKRGIVRMNRKQRFNGQTTSYFASHWKQVVGYSTKKRPRHRLFVRKPA